MIYLLVISLLLLTIISYAINKKELIAPSFVFSASFLFSSIWAFAFRNEWMLETFHKETFFVITGGVLLFMIVSWIVKHFTKSINKITVNIPTEIKISGVIKFICIIFSIFSIIFILGSVIKAVGYSWNNIFEAIERYDHLSKFSNQGIGISKIATVLRYILIALSYWYLYIFINNIIVSKKTDFASVLIVFLGLIGSMITGGRNGAINIVISSLAFIFLILYKYGKGTINISRKSKIIILMIPVLILVAFPKLTSLVGRNVSTTSTYYLAIYCGAEIKNLDTFISEYGTTINPNKKNMTFRNFNSWMGPKLGYTEPYKYDLPFRSINDYSLGNVYTTFYAYIYDYGYVGMIVLVSIMSIILQSIYEKCKRVKMSNAPNMSILLYGYMFSSIVLSFFSNKFYEQNFNSSLFYCIVLWFIFNRVLIITYKKNNRG